MRIIIAVACLWAVTSPLWGKIVFHSERDGNVEIYTMDSDGSNQTRLTFNAVSDAQPVWSPDGQQIAFTSLRDGNYEVYVMDTNGNNQRNLTNHPRYDSSPDWSPDGTQIIFASTRNADENHRHNIFVMDADGRNVKQITHRRFAVSPRWSPDGKRIAFRTNDDKEVKGQIYVINTDGTNPWRVSNPKLNTGMLLDGWSPDGTQILYTEAIDRWSKKTTPVVAVLDPAKQRQGGVMRWRTVPVPEMPFDTAAFSPDGKSILFAGKQAVFFNGKQYGDWDIYRFRLADKQLIQLTDTLGRDAAPQEWDPRLSVPLQGLTPTLWGKIKKVK